MKKRAVITGVGHYLPKRIVQNSEFEETLNTSNEWIVSRSGILQRHFSNKDETTSKMAIIAGQQAIKAAKTLESLADLSKRVAERFEKKDLSKQEYDDLLKLLLNKESKLKEFEK